MEKKFLPIGSVVRLKNGTKKTIAAPTSKPAKTQIIGKPISVNPLKMCIG